MKKMLSILMVLMMVLSMISLAGAEALPVAEGTELRMATGYNNAKTGLTFDSETVKDGSITLADGVTYSVGDLKPTWVELEKILGVKFVSVYQGNSNKDEFNHWLEKLQDVDMVCGTAEQLSAAELQGLPGCQPHCPAVHYGRYDQWRHLLQPLLRRRERHRTDAPDARGLGTEAA